MTIATKKHTSKLFINNFEFKQLNSIVKLCIDFLKRDNRYVEAVEIDNWWKEIKRYSK